MNNYKITQFSVQYDAVYKHHDSLLGAFSYDQQKFLHFLLLFLKMLLHAVDRAEYG